MSDKKETTVIERKENCCIVGCSDSKNLAPFKEEGYEFWGVNNLFFTLPEIPWTRWFEMHEIEFNGENFLRRGEKEFRGTSVDFYLERLAEVPCPVYMQQKWPSIKNSVAYPKEEIVKKFGRYITNTISWEIALAIHEGFKKIAIYGVDMAVGSEYGHQRPSCEYFIGIAQGMGINVIIPDEADLLKTRYLYGYERKKEIAFQKKVKHTIQSMQQRQQQAEIQRNHFSKQVDQYVGGTVALHEMLKIWDSLN